MTAPRGAVAVISGAASGIGAALAREFASAGGTAVVLDRTSAADGDGVHALAGDVRSGDDCARTVELTLERYGWIDYVFAHAGIAVAGRPQEIPADDWVEVLDVNVVGAVRLVNAALPAMIEAGAGHVVFTGSPGPLPLAAPYVASKFALAGAAQSYRLALAARGITVSLFCPPFTPTGFMERTRWVGMEPPAGLGRLAVGAPTAERVAAELVSLLPTDAFILGPAGAIGPDQDWVHGLVPPG